MKTITTNLNHALKKILVLTVSSAALGLATVAGAQDYTYTFTGTSGTGPYGNPPNFIDGSTLTISGGTITTYDITSGFGNIDPATSTVVSDTVTSYGPGGWSGELDLGYAGIDIEVTGNSFASVALGSSIQGVWAAPVPEPSTFALLGAVAVGLAAWRPLQRRLN